MPYNFNPRFLAYCRVHGFRDDPVGMLAHDRRRWPGGLMTGFTLWIQERLQDFYKHNKDIPKRLVLDEHHRRFDAWLEAQ